MSENWLVCLLDKGVCLLIEYVFTLIFPNLFAMEDARSIDAAAMILVVKNSEPSVPSCILNLSLKKNVTQELRSGQSFESQNIPEIDLQ